MYNSLYCCLWRFQSVRFWMTKNQDGLAQLGGSLGRGAKTIWLWCLFVSMVRGGWIYHRESSLLTCWSFPQECCLNMQNTKIKLSNDFSYFQNLLQWLSSWIFISMFHFCTYKEHGISAFEWSLLWNVGKMLDIEDVCWPRDLDLSWPWAHMVWMFVVQVWVSRSQWHLRQGPGHQLRLQEQHQVSPLWRQWCQEFPAAVLHAAGSLLMKNYNLLLLAPKMSHWKCSNVWTFFFSDQNITIFMEVLRKNEKWTKNSRIY